MKLIKSALVIACMGLSSTVLADNMYYGGGLNAAKVGEKGEDSTDASLTALYGSFGARMNEYLSAEARLGFGVRGDDFDLGGTKLDVKLKNYYGAYIKAGSPLNETVFPYAIAGYTKAKIEASAFGEKASESETDFSYGMGVDVKFDNFTVNLEYMSYINNDDGKMRGVSLGFTTTF